MTELCGPEQQKQTQRARSVHRSKEPACAVVESTLDGDCMIKEETAGGIPEMRATFW